MTQTTSSTQLQIRTSKRLFPSFPSPTSYALPPTLVNHLHFPRSRLLLQPCLKCHAPVPPANATRIAQDSLADATSAHRLINTVVSRCAWTLEILDHVSVGRTLTVHRNQSGLFRMSPCLSFRTRSPALLPPFTLASYVEHCRLVVSALAVAHIDTIQ